MTLLELIANASANAQSSTTLPDYPVVLDPDSIFSKLNPKGDESNASNLAVPVSGWQISQSDSDLIDLCKKFFSNLEGKLKTLKKFSKEEFFGILNSFLENIRETLVPTMENIEKIESSLERRWECQKSYVRPRSSRDHPLIKRMLLVYIGNRE